MVQGRKSSKTKIEIIKMRDLNTLALLGACYPFAILTQAYKIIGWMGHLMDRFNDLHLLQGPVGALEGPNLQT